MEEGSEDLAWIWYLGEHIVENFFLFRVEQFENIKLERSRV